MRRPAVPQDVDMQKLQKNAIAKSPLPLITIEESRMLGIRVRSSAYRRIRHGVYVDDAAYAALQPWQRYAVRVHAFILRHPDAVLCMESAAVLLGLPLFGETRDIHIFDPELRTSQRYGDVCVHTSQDPRTLIDIGGVMLTSSSDTTVDLARVLQPARALAVADALLADSDDPEGLRNALRTRASQQVNARGRARLAWVWDHADARAESPAESVSRAVIAWSGFETPELQREFFYEGMEDRVDFFWDSGAIIGEADGWAKYGLGDPKDAAKRLADEKRREDRLRRHRHAFARWDLHDAWRVDPLCRALSAAGVQRKHPIQHGMLHTLRSRTREVVPRRR